MLTFISSKRLQHFAIGGQKFGAEFGASAGTSCSNMKGPGLRPAQESKGH